MTKKLLDLNFGLEKEKEHINIIESFLNSGKLIKSHNFGIIDFYNDKYYIELKSRRFNYNKYNTTIIGKNKIDYFNKLSKECYIIYSFTDGLYYIKYNKDLFDLFDIKNDYIFRDNKKENKINYHIPIKHLKKMI